jgi:flagellar biosynthesis protein FliQ
MTVSTVSRLLATGSALFLMMPWMWRHLVQYTIGIFSDFHGYLQ